MVIRHRIILAAFTVGLFAASAALAQNILLPSSNNENGSLPNLGLAPTAPANPPAETQQPAPVAMPQQPVVSPVKPASPAQQKSAQTYSLTIALAPNAVWNANDMRNIGAQFGLSQSGIASQCQMSIAGMLATDTNTYTVDSQGNSSVKIDYAGNVTNAMLSLYALCSSAPRPAAYNSIQKVGDKYAIPLNTVFCQPRVPFKGTFRTAAIIHEPRGNDTCTYVP